MALLSGEHYGTLDEKNRVSIPAPFRKGIPDNVLVLTRGMFENCIWAYTSRKWEQIASTIKNDRSMSPKKTDMVNHRLLFSTYEVELDQYGRITIPQKLKDFAGLDKDMVITSDGERIELWNAQTHAEYERRTEENWDDVVEELGHIPGL